MGIICGLKIIGANSWPKMSSLTALWVTFDGFHEWKLCPGQQEWGNFMQRWAMSMADDHSAIYRENITPLTILVLIPLTAMDAKEGQFTFSLFVCYFCGDEIFQSWLGKNIFISQTHLYEMSRSRSVCLPMKDLRFLATKKICEDVRKVSLVEF